MKDETVNPNHKFLADLRRLFMRIPDGQEVIITQTTAGLYPAGTLHRHLKETSGGFGLDAEPTEDFRLPDGVWPYSEGN